MITKGLNLKWYTPDRKSAITIFSGKNDKSDAAVTTVQVALGAESDMSIDRLIDRFTIESMIPTSHRVMSSLAKLALDGQVDRT